MAQSHYLQQILGTEKNNPVFTVFRDSKDEKLHVYYGAQLLEIVPAGKEEPAFKLLIARLYNAGIKIKRLYEAFGIDPKTMKVWGDALKNGDPDKLVQILRGRAGNRKLTPEIEGYIRIRFPLIYAETRYDYSKKIRQEILAVFGQDLSSETLRPLLKELKQQANITSKASDPEPAKQEYSGDLTTIIDQSPAVQPPEITETLHENAQVLESDNRRESPDLAQQGDAVATLRHHVGVLIFSTILLRVEQQVPEDGWLLKQWLATIFLGAVNIEQTKLLDFGDLGALLGKTLASLRPQRLQLGQLASPETIDQLAKLNGDLAGIDTCDDLYYDPHGKEYTGMQKVLKGWCAAVRGVAKTLYMDFIHTVDGHPVWAEYTDNYEDLRVRFYKTVDQFSAAMGVDEGRILTFVIDRGIYSYDVFNQVIEGERYRLITWLKGYKPVEWDKQQITGKFLLQRPRNNSTDLKTYRFEYIDEPWPRDERMRLLRVQATNPRGRSIQVGVLCNDGDRKAEEIITLIFSRWLQENDFKYLEAHFGINQITSYASTAYSRLQGHVDEQQMKSGEYKALEHERQAVRSQLKKLLLEEHQRQGKNAKRQERIAELDCRDGDIGQQMAETEKEVSRLEYLIKQEYVRLDTRNKQLMDMLKLIARNAFYNTLEPFKDMYDNYRDDHVLFRNLTHAHGVLIEQGDEVEVVVYPTVNYAPKMARIVREFLTLLNDTDPLMPDGSGRRLHFRLAEKRGIEVAIK